MPKIDINYNNTIIYKLVSTDVDIKECYIGHTTNFIKRKCAHKTSCNNDNNENNKSYNFNVYQFIRQNGGWDNWTMILIEKYVKCNDRNDAGKRERHFIEKFKAT